MSFRSADLGVDSCKETGFLPKWLLSFSNSEAALHSVLSVFKKTVDITGLASPLTSPNGPVDVLLISRFDGKEYKGSADTNGYFSFPEVDPGVYDFWAYSISSPWRAAVRPGVEFEVSREKSFLIKLLDARWVRGVVLDEENRAVFGATVTVFGNIAPFQYRTTTDKKGRFEFLPLPFIDPTIEVFAEGFLPVFNMSLGPSDNDQSFAVIKLRRGSTIIGKVTYEGKGVLGALVQAQFLGQNLSEYSVGELGVVPGPVPPIPVADQEILISQKSQLPLWSASTDSKGVFQLTGLLSGETKLQVAHPNFLFASLIIVVKDIENKQVDIVLQPVKGRVEGSVVDSFGLPIIQAKVIGKNRNNQVVTTTNNRGRFILSGMNDEEFVLYVEHPKYVSFQKIIEPHVQGTDVVLTELGRICGIVREWRTGAFLDRVLLMLGSQKQQLSLKMGEFSMHAPLGRNQLTILADGYAKKTIQVVVPDPQKNSFCEPLNIELIHSGEVEGRVLWVDGEPIPSAKVSIDALVVKTDETGNYYFKGVPEGSHVITVHLSDGRKHVSQPVLIVAGQTVQAMNIYVAKE